MTRVALLAGVLMASLVLASCSGSTVSETGSNGSDDPDYPHDIRPTSMPAPRVTPTIMATEVPPHARGTPYPAMPEPRSREERLEEFGIGDTPVAPEETPEPEGETKTDAGPWPRPDVAPEEFPDIALLATTQPVRYQHVVGYGVSWGWPKNGQWEVGLKRLYRIYVSQGDGGPVRETLLVIDDLIADFPGIFVGEDTDDMTLYFWTNPGWPNILAIVCHSHCRDHGPPNRTSVFESTDQGASWRLLITSSPGSEKFGWTLPRVLTSGLDGEGPQIILSRQWFEYGPDPLDPRLMTEYISLPSGQLLQPDPPIQYIHSGLIIRDGRIHGSTAYKRPNAEESLPRWIRLTRDGQVLPWSEFPPGYEIVEPVGSGWSAVKGSSAVDGADRIYLTEDGQVLPSPEAPEGYEIRFPMYDPTRQEVVWLAKPLARDDGRADIAFTTAGEVIDPWPAPDPWLQFRLGAWPWLNAVGEEPTYIDSETGEERMIAVPPHLLPPDTYEPPSRNRSIRLYWGERLFLLGDIRYGPFLRVVDMGDGCLPIVSEASDNATKEACVAERALLQDQGGAVITDDGVTWRKVKTPAGAEGWADGRYLE